MTPTTPSREHNGPCGGRVARRGNGDLVASLTAKWQLEQQHAVGDHEQLDPVPAAHELAEAERQRRALDELHHDKDAYEDQPRWRHT